MQGYNIGIPCKHPCRRRNFFMPLRTNKMRVGKWPLRHSASNFCGVGLRGGGVRDVLGPATPGHLALIEQFWADF